MHWFSSFTLGVNALRSWQASRAFPQGLGAINPVCYPKALKRNKTPRIKSVSISPAGIPLPSTPTLKAACSG